MLHSSRTLALATLSIIALATPTLAATYAVPAGCTAPSTTFAASWYVDPVSGSDAGDGSQARPWKTLQSVITTKVAAQKYQAPYVIGSALLPATPAGAVVHGGDVIWLASGDHGSLMVDGLYNSNFVVIKAMPKSTPVLTNLVVRGGSHWVFDGITVQSLLTPALVSAGNTLVNVRSNPSSGPLDNIILNGMTIRSTADASAWTPEDWSANAASGILLHAGQTLADGSPDYYGVNQGHCFAVSDTTITNVVDGITVTMADQVLVLRNKIKYFSGDGIDWGVSDALFDSNKITDSVDDGSGQHRDGAQGQPYLGAQTFNHDITFSRNLVIQRTDPSLLYNASLQGIDAFDGKWSNITAVNNIVMVNSANALFFAGVNGAKLFNNTVPFIKTSTFVQSGQVASSTQPLSAGPLTDDGLAGGGSMIGVGNNKDGTPPSGVVIRNNIASNYALTASGIDAFDHNILISTNPAYRFQSAMVGAQPTIADPAALFQHWEPAGYHFDVRLAAGSPAIGFGVTTDAPGQDIIGTKRVAPFDAGALASQPANVCYYLPQICTP